jgi:hypothetical protein
MRHPLRFTLHEQRFTLEEAPTLSCHEPHSLMDKGNSEGNSEMEQAPATIAARLERLTNLARAAAEQGRWDCVGDYYREREAAMQGLSLRPQDVEPLLAVDRWIGDHARTAQAALEPLIREAVALRRRLNAMRQEVGGPSAVKGTISVEG